jgi:adenine C2-methylase RlmN of 23S rRNA A2503 and tRNA A37
LSSHHSNPNTVDTTPILTTHTEKFEGRPSDKAAVTRFINILEEDYGIPATVRIRRGIDIDGGCGQLKGKLAAMELLKKKGGAEEGFVEAL